MDKVRDLARVAGLLALFAVAFALDLVLYAFAAAIDFLRASDGGGDDAVPPGR